MPQSPVVGDTVYYFMPDRSPRAAIVVRAWEGDHNEALSLRVLGTPDDRDLAAREGELRTLDGASWYANLVNRRSQSHLSHVWDWRPVEHDATGRDISRSVPDAQVVREKTPAGKPIKLDEPQATPPPPLPA